MKNKYKRNGILSFLVIVVTIIVYLVIHLYYGGLKKEIYQCNTMPLVDNIYTIKNGDDLESIARMYNIPIEKLKEANNLDSNELFPGQKIIIPRDEDSGENKQPINNIIGIKEDEPIDDGGKKENNNKNNDNKKDDNVIDDKDIIFTYEYDEANYIYLINQFPLKDEIGKYLQGEKHTQDFKLKFNEKAEGVKYTITVEKLDESDLKEEWTKLFLVNDGADVLNCYRTNNRVKTFNEYKMYNNNSKERVIYESVVTNAEAHRGYKDFTFRMWVSEDLQLYNSDYLSETKTFKTRINVYATKD